MYKGFAIDIDGDIVHASGYCVVTGEMIQIDVPLQEFKDYYENGLMAQNAFKSLTAEQREYFISGVGPTGWKKLYDKSDNDSGTECED